MNVRTENQGTDQFRAGMTMQEEVVDPALGRGYGWSDSVSNLSAKFTAGKASDTRKYWSLPMCWDTTSYGSKTGEVMPGKHPS